MHAMRRSAATGALALVAGAVLFPGSARSWYRIDLALANESSQSISVAAPAARDAIVMWEGSDGTIRVQKIYDGAAYGGPYSLGAGHSPVAVFDGYGVFRLFYASGNTILEWRGDLFDLHGPMPVSAGNGPISPELSVSRAPDGDLYMAWRQDGDLWVTRETAPYQGWDAPMAVPGAGGWGCQVTPKLVGGSWQPRVYYHPTLGSPIAWRQLQGPAWGPETPVPVPAVNGSFRSAVLPDGRHAILINDFTYCGVYLWEEDADGNFQAQPSLLSPDPGACTISESLPMPFASAVDAAGRFHVFRYEACWEYYEDDIWGCWFSLSWQWRESGDSPWARIQPNDFPGSNARAVAMDCARSTLLGPVFAWSDADHIHLRIMNPTAADAPETVVSEVALQVLPNPARGEVALRWSAPSGAPARLQIFDPAGRLVRSVDRAGALDRAAAAPSFEWRWDGRDGKGVAVPSGVYLARISCGAAAHTTPIVWTR